MKKRKYSAGGGVPTTGENYGGIPAQYPFPSSNVGESGITSNTSVNINGQEVETQSEQSKLTKFDTNQYRRGGKVKRVRGDGIAQRGRTRGRFV